MKINKLMYPLMLLGLCFLLTNSAIAQDPAGSNNDLNVRMDSMVRAYDAQELKKKNTEAKTQDRKDAENLSDLKSQKAETKVKANEAQKVEREANDAAKESRSAYKSEKKAQKARNQADKQAKKAAKARTISDGN